MAIHDHYKIEDDKLVRTHRTCPECGDGVFLAKHEDRESCGRCGHSEAVGGAAQEPTPDKGEPEAPGDAESGGDED